MNPIAKRPRRALAVSVSACVCLAWAVTPRADRVSGRSPPGPNWSVLPIPLEKLAGISELGHNNKPLPTPTTTTSVRAYRRRA